MSVVSASAMSEPPWKVGGRVRSTTPRKPGQITASKNPGAVHDVTWMPVAGSVRLRDVDRVPDEFCWDPPAGDRQTHEIGVLVDLTPVIDAGIA